MSESNTIKLPEVVVFAGPNGSGKTTITRMADEMKEGALAFIAQIGKYFARKMPEIFFWQILFWQFWNISIKH